MGAVAIPIVAAVAASVAGALITSALTPDAPDAPSLLPPPEPPATPQAKALDLGEEVEPEAQELAPTDEAVKEVSVVDDEISRIAEQKRRRQAALDFKRTNQKGADLVATVAKQDDDTTSGQLLGE